MWETREVSIKSLKTVLKVEADIIFEGFELIERISDLLDNLLNPTSFSRVANLVLVKGSNLCQGIFCLVIEGLGQEAGALLRPTIESIELLCYIEKRPDRVEQILSDKKPSVGEIAKEIEGHFHDLRKHLNTHASHLSISFEAMNHLIDFEKEQFVVKKKQGYSEKSLKANLRSLFSMLFFLCYEGTLCLNNCGELSDDIAIAIDNWKLKGGSVFR
ncbi:MAG: hypothetical protein K0R80_2157 [Clostridia bacterium]|jgi:hypothetical protein|nr:hypothetical protein [Clostridia bacterium]